MKCLRDGCTVELTGRQRTYCSDKCRKAVSRTNKDVEDCAGEHNSDKVGQIHRSNSDKPKVGHKSDKCHFNMGTPSPPTEPRDDVIKTGQSKLEQQARTHLDSVLLDAVYDEGADSLATYHKRFIADGGKDDCRARVAPVKPQSYNPMMVGYSPPHKATA